MAHSAKLFDWRGSLTLAELSDAELQFYGAPTFAPAEAPDAAIVGFINVGKRVLQELFMPNSWKSRNFTREKTEALAEAQHAAFCWHEPRCPRGAVKTWRALGASPL